MLDDGTFQYLAAYTMTVTRASRGQGAYAHPLQPIVDGYAAALGLSSAGDAPDPTAWAARIEAQLETSATVLGAQAALGRCAGHLWVAAGTWSQRDRVTAERSLRIARACLDAARAGGDRGVATNAEILRGRLALLEGGTGGRLLMSLLDEHAADADFLERLTPDASPTFPEPAASALDRVLKAPDDPTCRVADDSLARLDFAVAARRVDAAQAALIRLQIRGRTPGQTWSTGQVARHLLLGHGRRLSPLRGLVARWEYWRGFPTRIALDARDFLERASRIYRLAPVTGLRLTGAKRAISALAFSPHLARIRILDLAGQDLDDGDLRLLARSPHLGNLVRLDLSGNRITARGLLELAEARLPRLHDVDVDVEVAPVEPPVEIELPWRKPPAPRSVQDVW